MKTISQEYQDLEQKTTRKPVELYKIWQGSTYWYYTNGDVAVVYDGNTYNPGVVMRGTAQYDSDLDANTISVRFARNTEPIDDFIEEMPPETVWIEIGRLFRDQSPLENSIVFIGTVKNVSFKGVDAEATCVGFELFFKQVIPLIKYQKKCNHTLYSTGCGVTKASYKASLASITLSSDGLEVTHADLATYDEAYFQLGYLEYNNHKRMIVNHTNNKATIRYTIPGLATGQNVDVYAGCDRTIATCTDKFSNDKFNGFPYLPDDNPAKW